MKSLARQVAILLMAAALFASVSAWLWWKRGKWDVFCDHSVTLSEISQWKQPVLWVDARSTREFKLQHIPSAVRLTEDDWNELLPDLLKVWEPGSMVVVYCSSHKCHASEEVAKRLREEAGLKPVFVLRGGWEAWKGAPR
jgi:rhodanese-related sulfurtransferase